MARKPTLATSDPATQPAPAPAQYVVTRLPGAPPRRAWRAWELGDTRVPAAELTQMQVSAIAADPLYRIAIATE